MPVEALWMANHPERPVLEGWDDRLLEFGDRGFGLGNDGLIGVDVSRVSRSDDIAVGDWPTLVSRLLRHPDIWNVIGYNEGRYDLRLQGAMSAFMDPQRALRVCWKLRRHRSCDVRVDAVPEGASRQRNNADSSTELHGVDR